MTPEAFIKDGNKLYKELETLNPDCVAMIRDLLEIVDLLESEVRKLLAVNQKLLRK